MGTILSTLWHLARAFVWLRRAAAEFPRHQPDGVLTAALPFGIRF